jgi:putative heme degradation protein
VGEIGAPYDAGESDRHYWDNLVKVLRETDADFGYWALNPRKPDGNVDETYALLKDDWETVVDDWRFKDLQSLMKPLR